MKNSIDTMSYWPAKIKTADDIPANIKSNVTEKKLFCTFSAPFPSSCLKTKQKYLHSAAMVLNMQSRDYAIF